MKPRLLTLLGQVLMLGAWVELGRLAESCAGSPLAAFGVLVAWSLALAVAPLLTQQLPSHPATLPIAAALAASALALPSASGGALSLLPAVVACALTVALVFRAASGGRRRRPSSRVPEGLASLAMLPMMCGLPFAMSLCRAGMLNPSAWLALHLTLMAGPALLLARHRLAPRRASCLCAGLLALGALAYLLLPTGSGEGLLAALQGCAWSLARRCEPGARSWRAPALHALACAALAVGVAVAGVAALVGSQLVLGLLAAAWLARRPGLRARVFDPLQEMFGVPTSPAR